MLRKFTPALCALTLLTACASVPDADTQATAVDVMKNGGTYEYVKADGDTKVYANSSAALAKDYMGRHIDELPEATNSTKAVQNGDEVVCKVVGRTHTRLRKKKMCAPKKEWDLMAAKAKELARTKQVTRFNCRTSNTGC